MNELHVQSNAHQNSPNQNNKTRDNRKNETTPGPSKPRTQPIRAAHQGHLNCAHTRYLWSRVTSEQHGRDACTGRRRCRTQEHAGSRTAFLRIPLIASVLKLMGNLSIKVSSLQSFVNVRKSPADVRLSFLPFRVAVAPTVDVHDMIFTLTFAKL